MENTNSLLDEEMELDAQGKAIDERLKSLANEFIIKARLTLICRTDKSEILDAKRFFEKAIKAHENDDTKGAYMDFLERYKKELSELIK